MTIHRLSHALALCSATILGAQTVPADSGSFTIFTLQQRVGTEQYRTRMAGDTIITQSRWQLQYLGGGATLDSELREDRAGRPLAFRLQGATSTWTTADVDVALRDGRFEARSVATVRRGPAPAAAFPSAPYAPVAHVQSVYRHWVRRGRPAEVPLLPEGRATFVRTGVDTVQVAGATHRLQRFLATGLVWGRLSLWVDAQDRVVATVGGNAELDRSEQIRTGFEPALAQFVRGSVRDGIAAIAALTARVRPVHAGRFAIRGARLVDGTGAPALEQGTLVVEGGRIVAIGPTSSTPVPAGMPIVDGTGTTVLPGLFDTHVHYEQVEWPLVSLASGVTTARDAANEFELITALRDAERSGRILSPAILAAGVIDGGAAPLGVVVANAEQEARAAVRRYSDAGFEQIKIYGSLAPALVPVISDEAHRRGMTVTGHVPRGMTARAFIEAGADQINHGGVALSLLREGRGPIDWASAAAADGIRLLQSRGTVLEPTMARAEEGGHWRGRYDLVEPGVLRVPYELRDPLQSTGTDSATAVRSAAAQIATAQVMKRLRDQGVPIVLGTDLAVPGFSMYRELELAVRGGFTPMEAIQAATSVPARALGVADDRGALAVGKRADFIVVDGNPLAQIEQLRNVRTVVRNGVGYHVRDLWRLAGFGVP